VTERPGDQDLRARFGELRAEVEGGRRNPSFAAVLERASAEAAAQPALGVVRGGASGSRRRVVVAGAWASAALAATVAGLLLFDRGPSEDEQFAELVASYSAMSAGAMRSPTSGLLNVPGMDLVRGLPAIGGAR
jgi:hypothetical protein